MKLEDIINLTWNKKAKIFSPPTIRSEEEDPEAPEEPLEPMFFNGKFCPFCKRSNPRDTNLCVHCGQRPRTWQPEFRMLLLLLALLALVGLALYVFTNNAPPTR